MNKQVIVDALREIASLEENMFKSRAYLRAVSYIDNMTQEDFDNRKSFLDLPGIGVSINSKLLAYKSGGVLPAKLFKLREENKTYLDPHLYKIRKGFISKRIPYEEASKLLTKVLTEVKNGLDYRNSTGFMDKLHVLGSYRRHKALIADFDILMEGEDSYRKIVKWFQSNGYKIFVSGPMKATFVLPNAEKTTIDISWCHPENLPFSTLHFTGSASSNIRLRAKAKEMGYTLNQYGLYLNKADGNPSVSYVENILTERDIFEFLNEPYVEPKNR